MARIRTIKPEFFTSESILELDPLARIFFVALWCEADREGRLNWKPKTLKYRYLPADDIDVSELANQMIDQGLIEIYKIDDSFFCQITGFHKHQVINNRERESDIPGPNPEIRTETAIPVNASITRESGVIAEGKEGKEGKGKEKEGNGIVASTKTTRFKKPKISELEEYFIQQGVIDWQAEAGRFFDYYETVGWIVGKNKNPMKSWKGAANNWLRNKVQFDKEKQSNPNNQQSFADKHTNKGWAADLIDNENK